MHLIVAAVTAEAEIPGWIGRWTPGIGDPTLGGWFTVFAYFATAWLCYRALRELNAIRATEQSSATRERWIWWGFVAVLVALGINKQLDLQTAFTEGLRTLSRKQGWYEYRRDYQRAFIEVFALLSVVASVGVVYTAWRMPRPVKVAGIGLCYLFAFVLMRATSFHHVDALIHHEVLAVQMNWILELSGIGTIAAGAYLRLRALRGTARA